VSNLTDLNEKIAKCDACRLCKQRKRAVPGEGREDAEIMFIGEAPGWHEDQQGRPFVGPAGQFLDELLQSINLKRSEVYIANVVKCRPPSNRDPLPDEIGACRKWLDRQMELIKPKMIVTLGRYSMARFFPGATISKVHGTSRTSEGVTYFAMYHPAAALHQGSLRGVIMEDMLKIPPFLTQAEVVPEEPTPQKSKKVEKAKKTEKTENVEKGAVGVKAGKAGKSEKIENGEKAEPKQLSMF
jgi:uracil-DNA glycosylase